MRLNSLSAAVLVVFAAACTTQTSSPSPTPQPRTFTASPTAVETTPSTRPPTSSPAATAPPDALDWQRVDPFPNAEEGSAAVSVTAGGPGFVAVGTGAITAEVRQDAAVWTSADGAEWSAVTDDNGAFAAASMAGVTAHDGLLVAVGRDLTSVDQDVAASWTSTDGVGWERVESEAQFEQLEGAQMIDVTVGGPGFVAVGSAPRMDASAVWTSTDGTAWQRVPHTQVFDTSFMWSVAPGGPGMVAVGWRGRPEPMAAVWVSNDGLDWRLADDLPGGELFQVRSVTAGEDGMLVAVGDSLEGGQSAIWTSEDGVTWTAAGDPAMFVNTLISSVVAYGSGHIAAGSITDDAAVWTSPDGQEWAIVDDSEAFTDAYIAGLYAGETGPVIGVGATQENIEGTGSYVQAATAWHAE